MVALPDDLAGRILAMNIGKTLFAQLMDFLPMEDVRPDCRTL